MKRTPLRFAVLMDYAFSNFQEGPKAGIDKYLSESGVEAVYFSLGSLDPSSTEDIPFLTFFELITPQAFDGIIIVSMSLVQRVGIDVFRDRIAAFKGFPMISIGPSIHGEESVCFNNVSGMYSIVRHLTHDHGYKRFAYVSGPFTSEEARIRLFAFRAALDEADIEHDETIEFEGNFLTYSGSEAVRVFLDDRGLNPQVIVCANDRMAHGVCKELKARGKNIPYDIAVTGYDDVKFFNGLSHRLTTVSQSFERLGYLASKRLHAVIDGTLMSPIGPLDTELRIRSSCGCLEFTDRLSSSPSDRFETGEQDIAAKTDKISEAVPDLSFSLLSELRDSITCLSRKSGSREDVRRIYHLWTTLVFRWINAKRPLYDLKELLQHMSYPDETVSGRPNTSVSGSSIIQSLYALMLEECNESVFIDYWDGMLFDQRLHMIVDDLHNELANDLSFESHLDSFKKIALHCRAKSFHLIGFKDFSDIHKGAIPLFTLGKWDRIEASITDGQWFPPRGSGSFAANMITKEGDHYGYILLDSDIDRASVHDYLRVRLSYITLNLVTLRNIRKLNKDLVTEISAREASERKLKEALAMVEQLSVQDELTNLLNRRGFFSLADHQIQYLRRQDRGFLILYADLDGLKTINDIWGHNDGDLAILSTAKGLKSTLRDMDIVARMGGDEFTALISEVQPLDYKKIKLRIVKSLEQMNIELNRPWKLAISIGVYYSPPGDEHDLESMLFLADTDLYKEKKRHKEENT